MLLSLFAALAVSTAQADHPAPPPIPQDGAFQTQRRYAADARQGVAVSATNVYAVSNWSLTRYDKASGETRATWSGDPARFPHINSCSLIAAELVCAASNFPAVPHVSTVEVFDPQSLEHRRSISLGLGTGSLTWIERRDGAWWGMFAIMTGGAARRRATTATPPWSASTTPGGAPKAGPCPPRSWNGLRR